MNQEDLKNNIEFCINNVLKLAKVHCRNTVSTNLFFIVSDFNEFGLNFPEYRASRSRINNSKTLLDLDSAVEILYKEMNDLYDIILYIFRVNKYETILEIQYYRKSNLNPDYFAVVKDNPPMFHSKIPIPEYALEGRKFDANWESKGGIDHVWKSLVYKLRRKLFQKRNFLKK
ncbi:hypothetical protein [Chryseobacterium sp. 'Rf worker isolate 10']|uniref:hypothetical protein n=1 Tax=Chryseobacterium sp. 'Rf worker isolate 10' TaxID=2887348 RepID=UPI003D6F1C1F